MTWEHRADRPSWHPDDCDGRCCWRRVAGWLPQTRVRARFDGRVGTVVGEPGLYPNPTVRWDDGSRSDIDGSLLERAPDDWLCRAVDNVERL